MHHPPRHALIHCSLAVVLAFAVRPTSAEWKNSLKPLGTPAGRFTAVERGQPKCAICLPAQPSPIEQKAAEELRYWVEQSTRATLPISNATNQSCIIIKTDPSLSDEGYRIALNNNELLLAGGVTRGVINAVYALLEEDLGYRFYTNESLKFAKGDTLAIEPVARTYNPQLRLRDPYYKVAFDGSWSLRNRTNAPNAEVAEEHGGHMDYGGLFVHTHAGLLPPHKYFDEHPEYFALNPDGHRFKEQLCPTDPHVAKIVSQQVLDTVREHPNAELISVSKNDSAQMCMCERCNKIRQQEGGANMACQLVLVNAVAEEVEKHYPRVAIDTLAYLDTLQPPKSIRPQHNVVIRLCNDESGSWVHPFTPAEHCHVAAAAAAWSKFHNRIYIWDYTVNFSHYLAPMPNIDVMAANIRFWAKHKAEGVMLQGGYEGPAECDEMKCWVTSKLLWDPARDEHELVCDFIEGHYGAAAPAVTEYESLLENLRSQYETEMETPTRGIRYPMDSPFFSRDFLTKATAIFTKAKQLARSDTQILHRVERAELPVLYVKCARGPEFIGNDYATDVAEFERIARREHVTHLQENGANFESALAQWKKGIIPRERPAQ